MNYEDFITHFWNEYNYNARDTLEMLLDESGVDYEIEGTTESFVEYMISKHSDIIEKLTPNNFYDKLEPFVDEWFEA